MDRMLSSLLFASFLGAVFILIVFYVVLPERIKQKLYNFIGGF